MEKFAVDLDKVLDELEFNEDRAENLMASGGRRHASSSHPQDHCAVPLHCATHVPLESGDNGNRWRPKAVPVSQKTSVSGVFSSLNEYLNSGRPKSASVSSENSGPQQSSWSPPASSVSSLEEKPDLIDSSVVRPSIQVSVIPHETTSCDTGQTHQGTLLPDIATAGTLVNPPTYEEASASFDLISHRSSTSDLGSLDVEVNGNPVDCDNNDSLAQNAVISFGALDIGKDLNDEDLDDYLSDLEREEQEQEQDLLPAFESEHGDDSPASFEIGSRNESHCKMQVPNNALVELTDKNVEERAASLCSIDTTVIVKGSCTEDDEMPKDSASESLSEFASEQNSISGQPNEMLKSCLECPSKAPVINDNLMDPENSYLKQDEISCQLSSESAAQLKCALNDEESEEYPSISLKEQIDCQFEPQTEQINEPSHGLVSTVVAVEKQLADSQRSEEKDAEIIEESSIALQIPSTSPSTFQSGDNAVFHSEISLSNSEMYEKQEKSSDQSATDIKTVTNSSMLEECVSSVPKYLPLTLSLTDASELPSDTSSPATPPTVPVTPTLQDPPTIEDFSSVLSTSSTPFLTPTAVFSDFSQPKEDEHAVVDTMSLPSTSASTVASEPDLALLPDSTHKPIRPSSLEIPICTAPAQLESAGSSEESPMAFTATIGPPGATPCANKPSIAEAVVEPQVTDESTAESSIEEGMFGAVGGEEAAMAMSVEESLLGKEPPFWVPDADAPCCMQCDLKFTVIKRRHHCRACGKVLCSKCCSERAHLDYINTEARVCVSCKSVITRANCGSPVTPQGTNLHPNPNNPMEYCSTVPPLQQVAGSSLQVTPSVMVPVGVLKREGSTKPKSEAKQVMFSDGIRPGADLAELDGSSEPRLSIRRTGRTSKRVGTPMGAPAASQRTLPPIDGTTMSYVPHGKGLPPIVMRGKDGIQFEEDPDASRLMAVIRDDSVPPVKFTINRNLYVLVKILNLDCCVNRVCWCFTSDGLSSVGQDEIVIILEAEPEEVTVPKDIFLHMNSLYSEAAKGNTVTEMGHTLTQGAAFLGSREHGGFLYVRPTFQCLHRLILPPAPYLVGVLIHKWETPWARVFPIRLMLRLGAEFRYYPCPLVSIRQRSAVYGEIGHTIIQLLADFRNMVYTLPTVRGLLIHMEDKQTTILLPRNRYDQVMRALNNSNDHVLAFGANFSRLADSHLVCMQSDSDHSYHTQAINIHNKPRKVTGASFVVFNGALKASCGMAAKYTIVEDGLMVKVTSETMASLQTALRDMKDLSITCGPINGSSEGSSAEPGSLSNDEVVLVKWAEDDRSFNIGVLSSVDRRPLDGVPSIRVHNGTDYHGEYRFIRWTEVFILESEEGSGRTGDPVDISRLSEQLAKATCLALVKLLDLLAAANLTTLAVRATIHPENVGYQAGSNGEKLPPIYMNSLDDELVPVLHEAGLMSGESPAVLELVFRIMESS